MARDGSRTATSAITIAVLAATSTKLISQTPPVAASASTTGCCHWLAPKTAHGPPIPCHDLIQSITTQQLGKTAKAASDRRRLGPVGPAGPAGPVGLVGPTSRVRRTEEAGVAGLGGVAGLAVPVGVALPGAGAAVGRLV